MEENLTGMIPRKTRFKLQQTKLILCREQLVRYIKSKNYFKDVRYFSFLEPKIEKLHIFAV
jgi:hypothetical protein